MITDKKRIFLRLFCVFVASVLLFCIILPLTSCSGLKEVDNYGYLLDDINAVTTDPTATEKYGDNESGSFYVIVPSGCDAEVYNAAKALCESIDEALGRSAYLYYEYEMPSITQRDRFIFVGNLENSVCRRNYETYRSDDYGYTLVDGVILVGGISDGATVLAIERFIDDVVSHATSENLMSAEDSYLFVGDYSDKKEIFLNGYALSEYHLVYMPGDAEAKEIASSLRESIEQFFGYTLPLSSEGDTPAGVRSICVGRTYRADTLYYECADVETAIFSYSSGLSVISNSGFGLRLGVAHLYELLCDADESGLEISEQIKLSFELDRLKLASLSFDKKDLSISEHLALNNEITAIDADVYRLVGISESCASVISRNMAKDYACVKASHNGENDIYYLYKLSALTASVDAVKEGDTELFIINFSRAGNGLDFSVAELFASDCAGDFGERVSAKLSERSVIFGRFFGDDEAKFLESCSSLERLSFNEQSFDIYISESYLSTTDIKEGMATVSSLTEYSISAFDYK